MQQGNAASFGLDDFGLDDRMRLFSYVTADNRVAYLWVLRAFDSARATSGVEANRSVASPCMFPSSRTCFAEATTELAVAYAKERHQFDRPIGSFQAVKHLLADMVVRAEVARAAVYAAGVTLDDPLVGDAARAVATAKFMAGEAARQNGKACVQVHGGMGFTWEVDAHLYLKRAWVLDAAFGSVDDHALAIADRL